MITADRYRALTRDTASDDIDVEEAIVDAQDLLEEYLGRPLETAERTEELAPDRGGMIWPAATPITEAEGWTIDGLGLVGTSVAFPDVVTTSVTYTGGWARPDYGEEEAPEGVPVLPTCLQRDLALAAYRLLHPTIATLAGVPTGASSVSLGDASISGEGLGRAESTDSWWSSRTRGYRHAPVGSRPPVRGLFV